MDPAVCKVRVMPERVNAGICGVCMDPVVVYGSASMPVNAWIRVNDGGGSCGVYMDPAYGSAQCWDPTLRDPGRVAWCAVRWS